MAPYAPYALCPASLRVAQHCDTFGISGSLGFETTSSSVTLLMSPWWPRACKTRCVHLGHLRRTRIAAETLSCESKLALDSLLVLMRDRQHLCNGRRGLFCCHAQLGRMPPTLQIHQPSSQPSARGRKRSAATTGRPLMPLSRPQNPGIMLDDGVGKSHDTNI